MAGRCPVCPVGLAHRQVPTLTEHAITVHIKSGGEPTGGAVAGPKDTLVVVKSIIISEEVEDRVAVPNIREDITMPGIIVPAEVRLQTVFSVCENIIVHLVIRTPVIRVDGLLGEIRCEDEVVVDASRRRDDAGFARADVRDVRHPAPAIPRPMIGGLAHAVE